MKGSETFQMSIDWPPKHRSPVPTKPPSVANENYGSLLRRRRGSLIRPANDPAVHDLAWNPTTIDRSRSHGHAP
jgi:hypothetical protein